MARKTAIFYISGMTCAHCEKRIRNAVKELEGFISANVSFPRKKAEVVFDADRLTENDIRAAIEEQGYAIKSVGEPGRRHPVGKVLPVFLIVLALYLIAKYTVGFDFVNLIPNIDQSVSLAALVVVGVLTSVHCIAMCGGINLSQSVGTADDSRGSLKRPLLYNLGRVISYTVIGGIVGGMGSVLFVSAAVKGAIMLVAAVFMILMSLSMLGWLPWWLVPRLPAKLSSRAGKTKQGKGPFVVGLLNGLLPCGPLQAMQLYALSTGSVLLGALSMLLFSLGTVPLMLGAGLVFSALKGRFTRAITRVSAVLVMLIAAVMLVSAGGLLGLNMNLDSSSGIAAEGSDASPKGEIASGKAGDYYVAVIKDGVQEVGAPLVRSEYPYILVQKGIPVRFNIKAEDKNINGCNNTVVFPAFGIERGLKAGDNIFEFTPEMTGTFNYTCWMGMIYGKIKVVDSIDSSEALSEAETEEEAASGSSDVADIDVENYQVAEVKDGLQELTVTMDETGFSTALLIVQKDIDMIIGFKPENLNESYNFVIFPEYNGVLDIGSGQWETPLLSPVEDFTFISYPGLYPGYVKVVDDLSSIDIGEIKKEVAAYDFSRSNPLAGGVSCH